MKINHQNITNKPGQQNKQTFKGGPLDGVFTGALVTMATNPMVNAAVVDVFSMVAPRTYVDTKKRNKYAGAETFFRELTGTFIVCLSSGYLAKGIANLYNKYVQPETKINTDSWLSNDSLELLKHSWDKNKDSKKYAADVLAGISGKDGLKKVTWSDIDWAKDDWYDDAKWKKYTWSNPKFNNVEQRLKNPDMIVDTFAELLDSNVDSKDAKQVLGIIEHRITNALKVGDSVNVELGDKNLSTSVGNLLRDTYDLGKNVFTNSAVDAEKALAKLQKSNKFKTLGALALASTLGLTNQYINRQITKKRTGTDKFVGDLDYQGQKTSASNNEQPNKVKLFGLKALASVGIVGLAAVVMKIKNPAEFVKKLEFTSPITSGNAIKTVYTATLVGRFLAAKNETELRESATRDYLGFLNWLVFGGFVSKGVANLLDTKRSNLFNIHSEGTGIKHWLNEISLKSHAEIASKGSEFAKKNVWKLNLAHVSGLAYSTIALGLLLPLLNIKVTNSQQKQHS